MRDWAPRVLVIGWDGADWRLLQPLMAQGRLPNLVTLLVRAAHGVLLSTVPPVTGPAWSSFITGCWPARHGLLSWQLPLNERLERPWVNASALHGPSLWQLLSAAGQRLGVLNVPLTYPPPALNGELVAGMLTPSIAAQFTYPPNLRAALLAELPGYKLDVDLQHTERDTQATIGVRRFLREVETALDHRERAVDFLWRRGPFDFFMVVFETPDRLQHPLYQFASGQAAEHRPDGEAVREAVVHLYARCDAILGSILACVDDQTTVILLSDHGFSPLRAVWHLNDWLAQEGYLTWASGISQRRSLLVRRALTPVKYWLPQRWLQHGREVFAPLKLVDWSGTQAYSGLPTEEGIWLNVRGREPLGIVEPGASYERLREELIAALQAFTDPQTGRPIVRRACRREEIHDGPFIGQAPDIVLVLEEGYKVTPGRAQAGLVDDVFTQGRGIHRREGIVAIAGPGVPSGSLGTAMLPDLLPTILVAAGLDVPPGLDGRPLVGSAVEPIAYSVNKSEARLPETAAAYSEEEAALIAARLRDLGYLE